MFNKTIVALGIFLLILTVPAFAGSDNAAIKQMANIMIGLNHYPTDAEKEQLKKISSSKDVSDAIKTMATAMMNMQHQVSSGDKAKLGKIAKEAKSAEVKELASIIQNVNHKPSAEAKAKLQKLAGN